MAEFFVVLLTTLVILFFSVLLWKWVNRRNQLINEERTRMRISRTDVRKNRLIKFDKTLNENREVYKELREEKESSKVITESSTDDDSSVMPAENPRVVEKEMPSNATKVLDEIEEMDLLQRDSNDTNYTASSGHTVVFEKNTSTDETIDLSRENVDVIRAQTFPSVSKSTPEANISRKWVSFSEALADELTSLPTTRPLRNLAELRGWNEGFDEFNISSAPLRSASDKLEARPRTLVCHDMKGGYLEDRFVQGFPSAECYRIYHWQYIDIFVYFSHNFVTIPPPCWTNAAHKHGVRVLGTFITEWDDGAKRCTEMFADQYSYQVIANQLVYIANYYRFDGWLINIENPIQPGQMNSLTDFIKYLTTEMHNCIPGSQVIWFDSVTYKGELKWQNELNEENRVFFDVSDGIFLNYLWNDGSLTTSGRNAGQDRRYDVYVGVDVFGRGCFGGGGWNTNKATKVVKDHDLSLALFAPGWVYENYQSTFQTSENKFWNSIAPDCTIHTLEGTLPFVTSFCQGYGSNVREDGKVVLNNPWTQLSAQQIQPSYTNHIYSLGDQHGVLVTAMEHSCQDAYNGGGCLLFLGSTKPAQTSSKAVVRIFKTDLLLPSTVLVSFTTKLEPSNIMDVALQLYIDKKPSYIMLCPLDEVHSKDTEDTNIDSLDEALLQRYGVRRSAQLSSDHLAIAVGQEHYRLFAPVSRNQHKILHALRGIEDGDENLTSRWCTRYYLLAEKDLKGSRIKEIRLVLMNKTTKEPFKESSSTQFKLSWGELKIIDAVSLRRPIPTVTNLHCGESEVKAQNKENNMVALSLTLSWSYDNIEPWETFEVYHITSDDSSTPLGWSFALAFFVNELHVSRSQKQVKFAVQAVTCARRKQPLENCPTIVIHWA